jgi:ABC-type amino acid transport substrate-binding protein
MRRFWIALCLLVCQIGGCAPKPDSPVAPTEIIASEVPAVSALPASLEELNRRGELIIGTAITEPFVYYDPQSGELVGFDIEIARYMAARLNLQLKFIELPFASLIAALQDNRVDMVIAAMYITQERELLVDFANPYADTGLVIAVHPELASQIKDATDLADLSVGVKMGATGEQLAEKLIVSGIPLRIVRYRDTIESLLELEVGRTDAVLNDYLNTLYFIKKNQSNIQIATTAEGQALFLSRAQLGIAVHEGNLTLLDAINQALDELHSDGAYDRLYQEYLLPGAEHQGP